MLCTINSAPSPALQNYLFLYYTTSTQCLKSYIHNHNNPTSSRFMNIWKFLLILWWVIMIHVLIARLLCLVAPLVALLKDHPTKNSPLFSLYLQCTQVFTDPKLLLNPCLAKIKLGINMKCWNTASSDIDKTFQADLLSVVTHEESCGREINSLSLVLC